MTAPWWHGGMCSLDSESTGLDLENDRLVELCFAIIRPAAASRGDRVKTRTALINPGVPVPEEAARVHGYTTERLQAEGKDPAEVIDVMAGDVALAIISGLPLVVMNAPFDLTLLDREARRHGLPTVDHRLDGRPLAPVIDPLVIDKHLVEKRRRVSATQGARQLKTLAQVWGVGWDDEMAHAAEYDALQAARVVWQLCEKNPSTIGGMSPMELHEAQVDWHAYQADGLRAYLDNRGTPHDGVPIDWPIRGLRSVPLVPLFDEAGF